MKTIEESGSQTITTGEAIELKEPCLVRNTSGSFLGSHLEALRFVVENATEISIAVAFLKGKGLKKVIRAFRERLAAGAKLEMFIGRDFWLTEPEALKELLYLSQQYSALKVYLVKNTKGSTFHPKVYVGTGAADARILLGSANLTGGALTKNEEMSLCWKLELNDPLLTQINDVFTSYRSDDISEELDAIVLEQYRSRYKIALDTQRRVEKEIDSANASMFDLTTLSSLFKEFRQDRLEMEALEKRRLDRQRALLVQQEIASMAAQRKLSQFDRKKFRSLFRNLVTSGDGHSHLWHSGDIHRRGQAVLTQPSKAIKLFAMAEKAAKLPVKEGYAKMREPASTTQGVGINMVSEMLCTFAPKQFAVFNGNTAAALRAIGANPPRSISLFSPDAYGRVCEVIEAVRRRTGGEDLSDVDAFLNWVYQNKIKTVTNR
ncbi:phospholipase D-like domain-containing protein [Ruegeria sp. MALMAid1280]|uniref:phospholipase D-like domain-containing protein n=1 Tax=Ruegeria sp. MALMAid1280 TaxID=3411634 RepID=UPI003B9FB53E